MARKILTYKEIAMEAFNQPVSSDPTDLTAIQYLGRNGATAVFHFDDEKITVQENQEINEQRVWNLDDPVEFEEMKTFVKGIDEVTRKIAEIEGEINNLNTFKLFKGIIDNDADVIALVHNIDEKRGEWLASVGLVGNSIIS